MPDRRSSEDFHPDDIPHNVVIQEALAPFLGGFTEAEEAANTVFDWLYGEEYNRRIVTAEDLHKVAGLAAHYLQFMEPEPGELEATQRLLRAALSERGSGE